MTRSIPKANDFVTFKHLIESIGPCAMAIEGLDERLTALEEALLKPHISINAKEET